MTPKPDYSKLEIVNRLPVRYPASHETEPFPRNLTGARILQIGSPANPDIIEGGGLVIDYQPKGEATTIRLVLGFSELGMWVESSSDL